jgi:hypothetical protein
VRVGAGVVATAAVLLGPISRTDATPSDKFQVTVHDELDGGRHFVVSSMPTDAANHKIAFFNGSDFADHVLIVVSLDGTGIDTDQEFLDTVTAVEIEGQAPPEASRFIGAVFSKVGQDHQRQFDLSEPGLYGFFCPIPSPDGTVRHFQRGFIGTFEVG